MESSADGETEQLMSAAQKRAQARRNRLKAQEAKRMQMIMGALHEMSDTIGSTAASIPTTSKVSGSVQASATSAVTPSSPTSIAETSGAGEAGGRAASVVTVEDLSVYDDPPVPLPQISPDMPRRAARRPPTAVKDNATTRAVDEEIEKERKRRAKLRRPSNSSKVPLASLQLALFAFFGLLYTLACRGCASSLSATVPLLCELASYRPLLLLALPAMVVIELITALVTVVGGAATRPCAPGATPAQLPGGIQNNMVVNMLLSSSPTGLAVKESLANAQLMMAYLSHIRFSVSVGAFTLVMSSSFLAMMGY